MNYADAGVSLARADEAMVGVKKSVRTTFNQGVLGDVGNFGGLFTLNHLGMKDPVLVSSVDGVGTKLKVDIEMGTHELPGQDIVNHCCDDILVQGARPLFFLDYVATGRLEPGVMDKLVAGMAKACRENGCVLIGGETAEMPGMYGNDYDLVGCITGIVEKDEIITGENIKPGHVALGLASVGLHTNGFSLARKVLFEKGGFTVDSKPAELGGETVGEALLKPHRCYWPAIREAMARKLPLDGIAHITGGGLYDNVPRILPEGVAAEFDASTIDVPAIFKLIGKLGDIEKHEMYRVFNMGVGMVWFIPETTVAECTAICKDCGIEAHVVGRAVKGERTSDVLNV